nr:MAG TPA: hypothetical protein [Caudoviricetes sp.]DAN63847.1 MAG TPA: hypothetical protein [Caudoviricetes sp.]DAY02284.1 MAG TPA: hypothetical protein [Caudoviricetes sp.]
MIYNKGTTRKGGVISEIILKKCESKRRLHSNRCS